MPAQKKRRLTAEDLYRFRLLKDFDLSPDGEHVVYAVERVDRKTEKKYTNLWLAPTRGGRPRQFTVGDHNDSHPRWSPDGSQIAFLSNRDDEKQSQIYLIPFEGGEARPLTDLQGSINGFEWSPDGRRLAFAFQKKDPEELELEKDEQKKKLGRTDRRITRLFFKYDGVGFLPKEREHIWTVDVRTGKTAQLTDGEVYDEWSPTWSPDGSKIVFCSNRAPDPDLDPDVIDLFVIPADGGRMRKIPTPLGPKGAPRFSPDGRLIAYLGNEGRGDWWKNTSLWVVPAVTSGKTAGQARNLTGYLDYNVASDTLYDLVEPAMMPPTWSRDGQRLYFQVSRHGSTGLHSISLDGEDLQTVIGETGAVGTYHLDRDGRTLAYFFGTLTDPGNLYARDLETGRDRQLTRLNQALLRSVDLGEVEEVWFKGMDGHDLQGWILKPPGFDLQKKYPSILEIHGGPLAQYGHLFMHEFYFLAAHGYVVYFSNPRGGQGYGEDHARAIWGAWGSVDFDDLMAWADTLSRKSYIDKKQMGVTGGSYGGYMTNMIIGRSHRFQAAVTQRSVSNLISMWGSSDANWVFQQAFGGNKPPWEDLERYWDQSPMKYIGNARTPTLVIHSEGDLRCAIEQGEQLFVALKVLGVDTEMIRFPDEPHGLSRMGRTDRRVARLHHILRWFDKYLKK